MKYVIGFGFGISALLALLGCSSEEEPAKQSGETPTVPATPVAAEALCDELADITCTADETCCESDESSSGSGGGWGAGGGGADGEGESEAPDCVTQQVAVCRSTIGKFVTDPRTGYDPVRGGELVARVRTLANGCWKDSLAHADVTKAFSGSGELGSNCTPDGSGSAALRMSALSCKSGSSCRLYLKADGSPMGVCEARADTSCSHPFDCAAGQWCDLPGDWNPGVWGECHPLRTEGWSCSRDSECQSNYCDAASKCAADTSRRYCLSTPYASEVQADEPLAYLRLGEASGTTAADASGNGHAGELAGAPASTSPGALSKDDDPATSFDGADDHVSVAAGAIGQTTALTLELWTSLPEGTVSKPLLAFGDDTEGGPVIDIDENGSLRVNFADTSGDSHVLSSGESKPAPNTWHHVVASYDGLHGELLLNGKKLAEFDQAFTPQTTGELHVGYSAPGSYFSGAIDEVAVYGEALTAGRILEHHAVATQGPERVWPLFQWFQ